MGYSACKYGPFVSQVFSVELKLGLPFFLLFFYPPDFLFLLTMFLFSEESVLLLWKFVFSQTIPVPDTHTYVHTHAYTCTDTYTHTRAPIRTCTHTHGVSAGGGGGGGAGVCVHFSLKLFPPVAFFWRRPQFVRTGRLFALEYLKKSLGKWMWVMAITPREVGTDSHLRWVHCSRRSVGQRGCGSPPRSRPRCHARRSCWCRGVSRSGRTQSAPHARSAPTPLSPAGRQEGVSVGAGFWSVSWTQKRLFMYTHVT